jgi:RNA polymerase sigma factor (sigma-70 family)
MVLNVCQRTLHHVHDADDVFQATFLVLMKKASTLRWRDSIAGWLHEVAYRLAVKARTDAARRRVKERRPRAKVSNDPVKEITLREAQAVLHEELHGLPEGLRVPLVLCYLESATQDEAARQLGWSLRTLKRRLERGRALLHLRLTRRGLTLSAVLSTALLARATSSAGLSAFLKTAVANPCASVSPRVAELAQGALTSMLLVRLKVMAVMMLLVSVLGTGMALYTRFGAAVFGKERNAGLRKQNPPRARYPPEG